MFLLLEEKGNGKNYVSDEIQYLSADKEEGKVIASASTVLDDNGYFVDEKVIGRRNGETEMVQCDEIEYMDVSPKQIVSVAAACVPFLEHDDATRALMGANMQRQAVPIINPESPIVGTGMEHRAAFRVKLDLGETLCEDPYNEILMINVVREDKTETVKVIGNDHRETALHITMSDILATVSYFMNLYNGVGNPVYPPARAELAKHGICCDGKHAVQLRRSDYEKYDL